MGPIVLILSYGSTKPIDNVKRILEAKNNSSDFKEVEFKAGDSSYTSLIYNIKNKYFETNITLLPHDGPLDVIPPEILQSTEAIIVNFASENKSILNEIPKLCELVEVNNIELGLLITTELFDDSNQGLSYSDIKDICKTCFDVIETKPSTGELVKPSEPTQNIEEEKEDYSEVIEALENHVWSNVVTKSGGANRKESQVFNAEDADLDEQQLEAYEKLLNNIVTFKNTSSNLDRHQLLDQAEKLAELFADFMADD